MPKFRFIAQKIYPFSCCSKNRSTCLAFKHNFYEYEKYGEYIKKHANLRS